MMEKFVNLDQWWNNNKCRCECKKCHECEKDYIWNLAPCSCENGKYLASIMDDSTTTCDGIVKSYDEDVEARSYDETKAIPTHFNEKKKESERPVSIYCYSIKY